MKIDYSNYINTLAECDLFRGIERDQLPELMEVMHLRIAEYQRGETISSYGDTVREMGIILQGQVGVEIYNIEGGKTNLNMLGRGEEFGSFLVLSGQERGIMHIFALEHCVIAFLDIKALNDSGRRSIVEWTMINNMLVNTSKRCMDLYTRVQIYGQRRVRARVRAYLLSICEGKDEVVLPMNRTALAQYLGVERTALARELTRMQEEGIIALNRRRVKLLESGFFWANEPR